MNISGILERFGIQNERLIEVINVLFTMLVVSLIGWLAYVVAKKFLPKLIKKKAGATRQHWSEWLLDQRFFNRLALLIMPIVLRTGLSPIKWEHMATINRILDIWIVVAIALLVSAFMSGINRVYEKMASVRDKPVKIITQVITVVIWCAVALIIISIFTRESLAVLLGGLTAFAAVLMLVFQDTILGFVAGIQLSSNNMVRLGDWIVLPRPSPPFPPTNSYPNPSPTGAAWRNPAAGASNGRSISTSPRYTICPMPNSPRSVRRSCSAAIWRRNWPNWRNTMPTVRATSTKGA